MSHIDPINKMMRDAFGDRSGLTAEQQAERKRQDTIADIRKRAKLTESERHLLLAAALASDGSVMLDTVDDLLAMRFYMGREYQMDLASSEITKTLARYADNGEATQGTLPLAKLGPGGDFVREVNL